MPHTRILKELKLRYLDGLQKMTVRHGSELIIQVKPDNLASVATTCAIALRLHLSCLFCTDERQREAGGFVLHYVFTDREAGAFTVLRVALPPGVEEFQSVTHTIYAASHYEREIQDLFGLRPIGHPDPKPLVLHGNWPAGIYPMRREWDGTNQPPFEAREPVFNRVEGRGVFEIPVGPVHAGIIEPGHFRFSVAGEPIINLEAQLYYVHRGIEKLCEGKTVTQGFFFSERVSGDESFANSLAYCMALERMAGVQPPPRAAFSRVLFAEMERLISHLGDLGGMCSDVAYGFAMFQFRMLRGWAYLLTDELCGVRWLRSINRPGGIRADFLANKSLSALAALDRIEKELRDTMEITLANSLFLDRIENTGILEFQVAQDLNVTGPAARAAGVAYDVRRHLPYAAYGDLAFEVPVLDSGDVSGRLRVKLLEALESIGLMRQVLQLLPEGPVFTELGALPPYTEAFGCVEAPRGESLHYVMTGAKNTLFRYKVRTASFCNWQGFVTAVNGNIVPDFPLINKSFNLSYAGNDL